ncbi:MAG: 3-oxoacyl-[acyl-carrier-protein] reductase [Candidatus Omnitrophica bacterium]|nr:3-oxoacyl-[acyl-carrier-protein] reductase [Candidatus Omnitrophota bacterium]
MLKDKLALITGGGQGIGREIACLFAQQGANIAIFDVREDAIKEVIAQTVSLGKQGLGMCVDVSKFAEVEKGIQKVVDKFGKISILVNNAGITRDALLLRMKEEDWDKVLNINLKGVFNCTKAVAKIMFKQREGKIINISSIIGMRGNVGQSNYAASKAAIIGFTKSIAREFASRNIQANAIAPGFIQTEMTVKMSEASKEAIIKQIPSGKLGEKKDVANLALFLASKNSNYINGEVIKIDGGMV